MLNRDICKKCIEVNSPEDLWDEADDEIVSGGNDSHRWREGWVCCPMELAEEVDVSSLDYGSEKINKIEHEAPPPEWCPYTFEHAVGAGMSNANC